MNIDEMVAVFRGKYPGSTDEQVAGYRQACEAEAAKPPEPDVPMPLIVVPAPAAPLLTSYDRHGHFVFHDLPPVSPEVKPPADLREELKEVLLGTYGLYLRLSPATQHRIRTGDLSESELLALI